MDSVHGTLVAATVATVTLGGNYQEIEVLNRSGSAEIFFTVDGADPTVGGNDTYIVPAVAGASALAPSDKTGDTAVRLISSATPTYSVTGIT